MTLPRLRLYDLKPRDRRFKIKLSVLMSIHSHRQAQMARSLECLCRQSWPGFEVMIAYKAGLEGMEEIIEAFDPFLELRTFPMVLDEKQFCPTPGLKAMMLAAKGNVIAIMQPEIMLDPEATRVLYDGHFKTLEDTFYWRMNTDPWSLKDRPRFVNLKVGFMSNGGMPGLDAGIDWHSDVHNIKENAEFMNHGETLSNSTNPHMLSYYEFPWWFAASAKANDPMWKDMHTFVGHAAIDLWMLGYRRIHNYVDVCPLKFMGYHQRHKITAGAPTSDFTLREAIPAPDPGTWPLMGRDELIEQCILYGIIGLEGNETNERLAHCLWKARKHTVDMVESRRKNGNLPFEPPKLPMPWGLDARLL